MQTTQPVGLAWTAADAADDLVGQLRELLAEGATTGELAAALGREGLTDATADALVLEATGVRPDARPDAGEPARWGIDVAPFRQYLRHVVAQGPDATEQSERLSPAMRAAETTAALVALGLSAETAARVVQELTAVDHEMAAMARRRLRRLGLQAMVAGAVFGSFFAVAGAQSEPGAHYHLLTAAAAATLGGYGWVVWRRNAADPH